MARRCGARIGVAMLATAFLAAPFARGETRESFDIAVPAPPSPVAIDGRDWLVYELHLTNFSREALRLNDIEVLAGGGDSLRSFAGEDLAGRIAPAGGPRAEVQSLHPGERAIVYLELALNGPAPRSLRHRVGYSVLDARTVEQVVSGETGVGARARLALGPPLRGGPWAAVYAWEWPRGHRRVFYTLDGRARLPGRFAIDWVRKDERGRSARGDADLVKNSLGYGADVLAVADARVAAVRDGIAESARVSDAPRRALEEKSGNFIALDLGDGRFAVYEHLTPGSIRIAAGDRVRRGQVVASLGFTGDSTEPHLHFHVADGPSPLSAEGLPFELEEFRVPGNGPPRLHRRERPAPNAVVMF